MLRYDRQTKPGLVALYDIRPGNGAGPFLQPRSPHGAGRDRESKMGKEKPPVIAYIPWCEILHKTLHCASLVNSVSIVYNCASNPKWLKAQTLR